MNKARLADAVDFAISDNYAVYDQQNIALKKVQAAKQVCIFGTGRFFDDGYAYLKEIIKASYVCDNNQDKWGKTFQGLKCISPKEMEMLPGVIAVIMIGNYTQVELQLENSGIPHVYVGDLILNMYTVKHDSLWFQDEKKNILDAYDIFEDDVSKELYVDIICNRIAPGFARKTFEQMKTGGEYFETGLFSYSDHEIFVDVGAYIGDTVEQFVNTMRGNGGYQAIYAFELEDKIYKILTANVKQWELQNVVLWNKGISDGKEASDKLISMDEVLSDEMITFVKMDIEGYELKALHGMEKIIQKNQPKLAVCLYHKLEDLWNIPQLIKQLCPEYQLYIRHHSPVVWDSVLYAKTER